MFNFPYLGYPYHRPYYQYYNKPINYVDIQKNIPEQENCETTQTSKNIDEKKVQRDLNSLDNNSKNTDTPIFEIFGFKLYSDDLIILTVLFLLYEQNVKDEMLYIILFLLLLS